MTCRYVFLSILSIHSDATSRVTLACLCCTACSSMVLEVQFCFSRAAVCCTACRNGSSCLRSLGTACIIQQALLNSSLLFDREADWPCPAWQAAMLGTFDLSLHAVSWFCVVLVPALHTRVLPTGRFCPARLETSGSRIKLNC